MPGVRVIGARPGGDKSITVVQGEFQIGDAPDLVFSTVLGSCVTVCLHDPQIKCGGMNHFLLPSRDGAPRGDIRYGAHAMELLINGLLKRGARHERLQAKVFGGATMASNLGDIGSSNAAFAHDFLKNENILVLSESLGGTMARRVRYWPASGRAQQLLIPKAPDMTRPAAPATRVKESVTLF